jgi:hypothetical protein
LLRATSSGDCSEELLRNRCTSELCQVRLSVSCRDRSAMGCTWSLLAMLNRHEAGPKLDARQGSMGNRIATSAAWRVGMERAQAVVRSSLVHGYHATSLGGVSKALSSEIGWERSMLAVELPSHDSVGVEWDPHAP